MILTISTVEGAPPEYPENITIKDKTGENSDLAGIYRRQGEDRVWKYGDFELSFNGMHLVNSFNIRSMISIMKEGSCTSKETMAVSMWWEVGTMLKIISGPTLTLFTSSVCYNDDNC